jgi:hypothetical protein
MTTPKSKRNKRSYSGLTASEAFALIGRGRLSAWEISVPPRAPSPTLIEVLRRLNSFMVMASEAGKELLIDALLAEIVPLYPSLRVWKGETLEIDTLIGSADYLIAPFLDYLSTPLLCAVEAKRDDFEAGEVQCMAEMYACRRKNEAVGLHIDVFGIVSNGQGWVFYRWNANDTEFGRTALFGINALPDLLSALDSICAACDAQLPAPD